MQPRNISPLVALILLCVFASPALAAGEIGNNWLTIIQALEAKGVQKVGSFSTRSFKRLAGSVGWYSIDEAPPALIAGSRASAYYLASERKIFVRPDFRSDAAVSLPQLELHELLGVAGFNDKRYQASTALIEIAQTDDASERKQLVQAYGRRYFGAMSLAMNEQPDVPSYFRGGDSGGGGTSVGGGGDLPTIHVKAQVLKLVKARGQVSREFLLQYPNISFEPLHGRGQTVGIQYRFEKKKRGGKAYREYFTVLVPMSRWNQGEAAQDALLEEIAAKVTALFPAYGRVNSYTFTPDGCPASVQVTYPYTEDGSVAAIQRARAGYIADCANINQYAAETTVGVDPRDLPRRSGITYYRCGFRHRTIQGEYEIKAEGIYGRPELKSLGVGWEGGGSLNGTLRIDARGRITHTGLMFIDASGQVSRPPLTPGTSAQMVIDGAPLTFSCQQE